MFKRPDWTTVLGLLALLAAAAPAPAQPQPEDTPPDLSAFGIALEPPKGWSEGLSHRADVIISWGAPRGQEGQSFLRGIEVIAAATKQPTVDALAQDLAQRNNGEVVEPTTTLGGERALRVRSRESGGLRFSKDAIVCLRNGFFYGVTALAPEGSSCAAEVEALRANWKWVEFGSPVKSLESSGVGRCLVAGGYRLDIPLRMYEDPDNSPRDKNIRILREKVTLKLRDFRLGATDFQVVATYLSKPANVPFKHFRDTYASNLRSKLNIIDPITWWENPKKSDRSLTDLYRVASVRDRKMITETVQWALVNLDSEGVAQLEFFYAPALSKDELQAAMKAALGIVNSVVPLKIPPRTDTPSKPPRTDDAPKSR